jgi:hypothetical protein
LTGIDNFDAIWRVTGDLGNGYEANGSVLGFGNFEVLNGGNNADTFLLGGGSFSGNLTINGNDGADLVDVEDDLVVNGDLEITDVETVTNSGGGTLSANLLRIIGAMSGVGGVDAALMTDVDSLVIEGAGDVYLSDATALNGVTIGSTGIVMVDANSDMVLFEVSATDQVTLTSATGDILNGNGDADLSTPEVSSAVTVTLSAVNGVVGTDLAPLTISAPNETPTATIFVSAKGGKILNPNLATVDTNVANLDASNAGVSAAVGASVLSALEEIGFVDWAGLNPDIRLVDCLEPCIKLPADQLEDEGLAILREPTQMLVIRTVDGIRLVPVFVQTTAHLSGGN